MLVILLLMLFGMSAYGVKEEHERDKEVLQWLRQVVPVHKWDPLNRADRENAYNTFRSQIPKSAMGFTRERFIGLLYQVVEDQTIQQIKGC